MATDIGTLALAAVAIGLGVGVVVNRVLERRYGAVADDEPYRCTYCGMTHTISEGCDV